MPKCNQEFSFSFSDDIEFFVSENNVLLTPGINGLIAPKYFVKAMQRSPRELSFYMLVDT